MSSYGRESVWQKTGLTFRLLIGCFIVIGMAYLYVVWIAKTPMSTYWPQAGLWAAVGWGASRLHIRPVVVLFLLGVMIDLLVGAPVGCWASVLLAAFLVSSLFRKRAQTDRSGMIRFFGDVASFVVAFIFARWLIGAYLDGVDTREIAGSFLTAGLLFFPFRALFRLSDDNRVDA